VTAPVGGQRDAARRRRVRSASSVTRTGDSTPLPPGNALSPPLRQRAISPSISNEPKLAFQIRVPEPRGLMESVSSAIRYPPSPLRERAPEGAVPENCSYPLRLHQKMLLSASNSGRLSG
jgi:hypothetical protein